MITIYGKSDDLIYVEDDRGGIREEFSVYPAVYTFLLAFSDGTVLSVEYTGGAWRMNRILKGTALYSMREATGEGEDHSDRVTLEGDTRWAVCARDLFELVSDCQKCLDDDQFRAAICGRPSTGKGMGSLLWDLKR